MVFMQLQVTPGLEAQPQGQASVRYVAHAYNPAEEAEAERQQ